MLHADLDEAGFCVDGVVIDRVAIADVLYEALEEAQRRRGVAAPSTGWSDAALAADLLLEHITNTCAMRLEHVDAA